MYNLRSFVPVSQRTWNLVLPMFNVGCPIVDKKHLFQSHLVLVQVNTYVTDTDENSMSPFYRLWHTRQSDIINDKPGHDVYKRVGRRSWSPKVPHQGPSRRKYRGPCAVFTFKNSGRVLDDLVFETDTPGRWIHKQMFRKVHWGYVRV